MRIGFQARVGQLLAARLAIHPYRRGNKALHQKAFWRADVGFINRDATVAQQFFIAHQLAVRPTI